MLNIGTKQYKLKRVIRRLDLKAASPAKGLQKTKKGGGGVATKRYEDAQGPEDKTRDEGELPAHACYQVLL